MSNNKPRVIKDYDKLDKELQEKIKLTYPEGFSEHLVYYTNKEGKLVTALPFETSDKYYLIKMTVEEAEAIILDDDDYDDEMDEVTAEELQMQEIPVDERIFQEKWNEVPYKKSYFTYTDKQIRDLFLFIE